MAASEPAVTVVVTCFDYGEYLAEAVGSARAQEGEAPHVIVVDDGSTDPATVAALERLPPEVELVRQPNSGLSAARNAGLARASTPYLIVLDADDRLMPAALATLRAALDREPGIGFSYGITRFFGDWQGIMAMPPYDPYKLLYRHIIGSTCLMRRELLEDVGGFDPAFRGYEDWELWLHALAHGWRGRRVEVETFEYRRHGQTMISGARREYRHWYRLLRAKHADLYARRDRLAADSDLGLAGRLTYRFFWGPRPLPAPLEASLQALLFGASASGSKRRRLLRRYFAGARRLWRGQTP